MCVHMSAGVFRSQKREMDPLDEELLAFVSCPM